MCALLHMLVIDQYHMDFFLHDVQLFSAGATTTVLSISRNNEMIKSSDCNHP